GRQYRRGGKAASGPRPPTDGSRFAGSDTATREERNAKGVAMSKSKYFEWGGIAASIILVAFGVVAILLGVNARSTVHSSLKQEAIVGAHDMNASAIKDEAKHAGI